MLLQVYPEWEWTVLFVIQLSKTPEVVSDSKLIKTQVIQIRRDFHAPCFAVNPVTLKAEKDGIILITPNARVTLTVSTYVSRGFTFIVSKV